MTESCFYEENESGIGNYFLDSVISDFESLLIYAGVHSKVFGFYRMPAKRFPYSIYYYIHNEVAIVVAVLPMRKNPTWTQSKLEKRR
ncbi:MAG: type II toxin-antitoxin system RelE/ParE family toxin [Gammaproteobacteria bacterium]|nr:type II toxin-antitoxin system RelE/ParE family toxin [Gammaproteobacteria bacterium]